VESPGLKANRSPAIDFSSLKAAAPSEFWTFESRFPSRFSGQKFRITLVASK
jgi:hypothetical protein